MDINVFVCQRCNENFDSKKKRPKFCPPCIRNKYLESDKGKAFYHKYYHEKVKGNPEKYQQVCEYNKKYWTALKARRSEERRAKREISKTMISLRN